jgi:glycosyltransferase involved in cell wall biosynthesis
MDVFGRLNARAVFGHVPRPLFLQRTWMVEQGPRVGSLGPWLEQEAATFDVIAFFTYLYYTTWLGVRAAAGRTAILLHPTAHEEPPFTLPLFDPVLRLPTAYGYFTEEEERLVRQRTGMARRGAVLGVGIDLDAVGDADRFRRDYPVGDRPYVVFIGRVDPNKGSQELYEYFLAYKRRRPGPLALVIVGERVASLPEDPDVLYTGYVPEQMKRDAIDGAIALVQPSYFESFSLVLCEAWAQHLPGLVNGRCDVLAGQAHRSGGAIPYDGYPEFEAALDRLLADPTLAATLGAAGRRYVESRYDWSRVMDRYERLLAEVTAAYRRTAREPV